MRWTRAVAVAALATSLAACGAAPSSTAPMTPSLPASAPPVTAAPSAPSTSAGPTSQASLDRAAGWRADLAAIIPGLERIHPDPFHGTAKDVLEAAIGTVSDHVPTATDDELMVGIARVAALVSADGCDGHTGAYPWGTGTYPVESLPIRLWLFGDELVIVDALGPHQELIGATIEAIEDHPIADVLAAIEPLIPRDNDQTVRLLTPRYLLIPQVLRGLDLADDGPVRIRFTVPGARADVDLEPIPMEDYNNWAGPYGLHLPSDPDVRYLSRIDDDLWWERLRDGETLYVQYNRVEPQASDLDDLRAAAVDPELERVILDLRHNFGGEVRAIDPILSIFDDPAVDQPGRLFVIAGRNTFSAATMLAARLEAQTGATFVGEPMGGCPTFYGDVEELSLEHSGLSILVASELSIGVDAADTRDDVPLDAETELTLEDWTEGIDPALELIVPVGP